MVFFGFPVQPVSESRGGSTSVTDEQTNGQTIGRTKEILVSNLGFYILNVKVIINKVNYI